VKYSGQALLFVVRLPFGVQKTSPFGRFDRYRCTTSDGRAVEAGKGEIERWE